MPKSNDPRTIQFSSTGFANQWMKGFVLAMTNMIFNATKMMVVLSVARMGFAVSDVSQLLGITGLIAGDERTGAPGLFQQLYSSIFTPMIFLAILGTAGYMIWTGLFKRQYRQSLGGLAKAIACFLAAVIIAVSPGWFVSLPNNVAVVVQSYIASSLASGSAGGDTICGSNIQNTSLNVTGAGSADAEQARGILDQASVTLQSQAGCMFWYNLVLRPWTNGQFGVEYEELAGSTAEEAAEGEAGAFGNRNSRWVGAPEVPLGGGVTTSNWALFQISTQTQFHSPLLPEGERGKLSAYSQDVAHD